MACRFLVMFAFVAGWAAIAAGQRVITLNPVDLTGSIVQIGPRGIALKAANGQNWILNLNATTKVKITGSAEREMLAPGTCVRFTARIDKRTSRGQEKLDTITIFTPTPGVAERTLGVERAGELPQGNAAGGNAAAFPLGPAAGPGNADEGADDAKTAKRRTAGAKGPDVADYDVCAQVVSCHGGRLIVSVQNRFLKPRIVVELSADAQIGLDLADLSTARPGDKISAMGYYVTPGVCDRTLTVEVALTNPLAPPGSRPHRARPAAHAGDAARKPAGKAKPGVAAAAGKNAAEADEKAPAEDPPPEKKVPPPAAAATPADDDVMPPAEDVQPKAKQPDEKPAPKNPDKGPSVQDDDKDVFEK